MNSYHIFFELKLGNHKSVLSTFTDMGLAENIEKPPMKTSMYVYAWKNQNKVPMYLPIAILYLHKISYHLYIPELKVVKSQNITEKQLSAMQ